MNAILNAIQTDERKLTARVDDFVEAFESARIVDPSISPAEFLPELADPDFDATATELLRVDLELRWKEGEPKRLADYQIEFRDLLRDRSRFGALAFEEYRLRKDAGERIQPADYRREFEIDTNEWPLPTEHEFGAEERRWQETVTFANSASQQLVEAIVEFPEVGSRFVGFEIERQLGQGCFGRVYLARQAGLADRPMVLKVTPLGIANGSSSEAQHLARMQHTNIVPIYSVHDTQSLRAICMPYLGPRTLADLLKRWKNDAPFGRRSNAWFQRTTPNVASLTPKSGGLDRVRNDVTGRPTRQPSTETVPFERACAEVAAALARGLEYAHERGIVHRDLKPANILITDEGQPLLLDFNVADDTTQQRSSASVAGTLPYMAPEQLRQFHVNAASDPRSDIYSFGVLLFEALTGQHPYPDQVRGFDAIFQSWLRAMRRKPVDPRQVNAAVPSDLASIVMRCLEPNVDHRYRSATDLRTDLERHLQDQPLAVAVDPSMGNRFTKWRRRNPRVSVVALVIPLLVSIVLGAFLLVDRSRDLRQMQAKSHAAEIADALPALRVDLSVLSSSISSNDLTSLRRGMKVGSEMMSTVLAADSPTPRWLNELESFERRRAIDGLIEASYLMAEGSDKLAVYEPELADQRRQEAEAHQRLADTLIELRRETRQQRSPKQLASDQATPEQLQEAERNFLTLYDLLSNGEFDEATTWLEQFRRDSRFDFSAWLLLGDTYLANGRLDEAEACFEAAVSLWPDLDRCYFHRGLCRLIREQIPESIDDFTKALDRCPNHLGALLNRGLAYLKLEQYELAERDFTAAIEEGCGQTRVWFLRSRARRALGDTRGADDDYQTALRQTPTDEQSAVALGNAFLKSDPDKALEYYLLAEQISPNRRSARRNIAHVLGERKGDVASAIEVLDSLVADFANAQDVIARGVLFARSGQRDRAIADADRALQLSRSAKVLFQAGCIYALTAAVEPDDIDVAIGFIAAAIRADGRWVQVAARDPDLKLLHQSREFRSMLSAAMLLEKAAIDAEVTPAKSDAASEGARP